MARELFIELNGALWSGRYCSRSFVLIIHLFLKGKAIPPILKRRGNWATKRLRDLPKICPTPKPGFFSSLHSPFVWPLCAAHSRRLINTFYKEEYIHTKFSPPARAESKRSFESKKRRHNYIIDMAQKNNFISQIPIKQRVSSFWFHWNCNADSF